MKKRVLSIALSTCLILSAIFTQSICVFAENQLLNNYFVNNTQLSEPNNSIDEAQSIECSDAVIYKGEFSDTNTSDWVKFSVQSSGYFEITSYSNISFYYSLFDENQNKLTGGCITTDSSRNYWLIKGDYYFNFEKMSSGIYGFKITFDTNSDVNINEEINSYEKSQQIDFNTLYKGCLYKSLYSNTEDWVMFSIEETCALNITAFSDISFYYSFWDSNQNKIYSSSLSNEKSNDIWLIKGDYYLKTERINSDGYYGFRLTTTTKNNVTINNGDTFESAQNVKLNTIYKGCFFNSVYSDKEDWIKFTLSKTTHLTLADYYDVKFYYSLWDSNQNQLYSGTYYTYCNDEDWWLEKGDYYIKFSYYDSTGYYGFNLKVLSQVNTSNIIEPNDSVSNAQSITQGKVYTGCFTTYGSNIDTFKVKVQKGYTLSLNFTNTTLFTKAIIMTGSNIELLKTDSTYYSKGTARLHYTAKYTGYYYIKVTGSKCGKYYFNCGTGPKNNNSLKINNVSKKYINISWNKDNQASGYIIYKRKVSKTWYGTTEYGKWSITTVLNKKIYKKYRVKNLKSSTKYQFKIVGFKKLNGKTYYSRNKWSGGRIVTAKTK